MVVYKMRKAARTMRKMRSKVSRSKVKRPKAKKKKTKGKKKPGAWNKHVMAVYKSMKSKNSNVKLGDAMKAAKKTYKKAATA